MNIETANRLLQYRKLHNLSQEELAEKIGVSRQAVSKWERAEASPDTDNLILLAEVYGVTLDELLQGGENPVIKGTAPEPDEGTNYVKDERFSFKESDTNARGDKVSFRNGIHVDTKDGTKVHIDNHGINVTEGEKTRVYTDEDGNVMVDEEFKHNGHHKTSKAQRFPMWAISLGLFLAWGFSGILCGWALAWICFLLIPLYHSLVDAIEKRNPNHFAFPVLCVAFQMVTGFLFDAWAWNWAAYLTIPIYYAIVNFAVKSKD